MSMNPLVAVVPRRNRREDVAAAMCREFSTWPRLSLTFAQAQRLWNLDAVTCRELLDSVADDGIVGRRADGAHVARVTDLRSAIAS